MAEVWKPCLDQEKEEAAWWFAARLAPFGPAGHLGWHDSGLLPPARHLPAQPGRLSCPSSSDVRTRSAANSIVSALHGCVEEATKPMQLYALEGHKQGQLPHT